MAPLDSDHRRNTEVETTGLAGPRDLEAYARLLEQAQQQQGLSLWQDARQRLKKKPVAMLSLGYLVGVSLLALITPLLPLQSPQSMGISSSPQAADRKLQPPSWTAAPFELREPLAAYDEQVSSLRKQISSIERNAFSRNRNRSKLASYLP